MGEALTAIVASPPGPEFRQQRYKTSRSLPPCEGDCCCEAKGFRGLLLELENEHEKALEELRSRIDELHMENVLLRRQCGGDAAVSIRAPPLPLAGDAYIAADRSPSGPTQFTSDRTTPQTSGRNIASTDPTVSENGSRRSVGRHQTREATAHSSGEVIESAFEKITKFVASFAPPSVHLDDEGGNNSEGDLEEGASQLMHHPTHKAWEAEIEESHRGKAASGWQCLMVSPVSRIRLLWDFLAFMCLMVDLWATPMELVFMVPEIVPQGFNICNYVIITFFCLDIILNFNTGYIYRDKLVMQRGPSIRRYVGCWFWVDLLATLPFDLIVSALMDSSGSSLSMARLARIAKLTKVLKTLRFLKMLRAVQQMSTARSFMDVFEPVKHVIKICQLILGLAVLAHIQGCAWALLQPAEFLEASSQDVHEAFYKYYESFRWAYGAFGVGDIHSGVSAESHGPNDDHSVGLWSLEMLVVSERIFMAAVFGAWGVSKAMTVFQDDAQMSLVTADAVRFFRQHSVSIETQISVMYSLHETRAAQTMQRHFKQLMSDHLPDELRRRVSEELWSPHLMTLGLIREVQEWHTDFVMELSLIVKEEVVASRTILCKEGQASISAYYIIEGHLTLASSLSYSALSDFTDGMWVGESAFLSSTLRRTSTVLAQQLSRLMVVPARSFHEMIQSLGLETQYREFSNTTLAKGFCGRCGQIGDHFTHACPVAARNTLRKLRFDKRPSSQSDATNVGSPDATQALASFLHAHRLMSLVPLLDERGVQECHQLNNLNLGELVRAAEAQGLKVQAELLCALLREQRNQSVFQNLKEQQATRHFAFLSHYKVEAGTEAALMRNEMEEAFHAELTLHREGGPKELEAGEHGQRLAELELMESFTTRIFLDSDDLSDLDELQSHVCRSHNLLLLLTQNVLLRPWVLVEIVTAVKEQINILPVQVNKPTSAPFVFPDEAFYSRLVGRGVLDESCERFLRERDISLKDVESALRNVFKKISQPFSPHRAEGIRRAEIAAIFRQCQLASHKQRSDGQAGAHRQGGAK